MKNSVPFEKLNRKKTSLVIDKVYEGGQSKQITSEPITKILKVSNQGGFRKCGKGNNIPYCVLKTSNEHPDWPDKIDLDTGIFIYYGDQREPGKTLLETKFKGNKFLQFIFEEFHANRRYNIPPLFVFEKEKGWNVKFRGLAVPGHVSLNETEDLQAIWRSINNNRFQNYKSHFSILKIEKIDRKWILDLEKGNKKSSYMPKVWKNWIDNGSNIKYILQAPPNKDLRNKNEQIPNKSNEIKMIKVIHKHFENRSSGFEHCAAAIVSMMDKNFKNIDVTPPGKDGGKDAIGKFKIGIYDSFIEVDFAMEAKCWNIESSCGVKLTKRLLSRLRHRQFGIFITTSYVGPQAYKEIIEDKAPVIIISAIDIINILKSKDIVSIVKLKEWLKNY